jgi:hypothetical protein
MRASDRIARLEQAAGTLLPGDWQSADDLTLCRFAIRETERAIANGSGKVPYDEKAHARLGVCNDEELLALLESWLPEYETKA